MIIILVHSLSRVILQNVKDKKVFINLRVDILNNYRLFTAYLGNWRLVDFLILFLVWRLMAAVSASPQSLGQKVPLSGVRGPGCSLASSSSSSSSSSLGQATCTVTQSSLRVRLQVKHQANVGIIMDSSIIKPSVSLRSSGC